MPTMQGQQQPFSTVNACSWNTLHWRHNGRDGVQITSLTIVYSFVYSIVYAYSDADQRKHQSSTSLAFVRGIPRTKGQ